MNETFWDAQNLEIEACANFDDFSGSGKITIPDKKFVDWTFFIENQSFFDNSFDRYPIGEKTEVADSEKRTPEAKFRPFISMFQKITVFQKNTLFLYFFANRMHWGVPHPMEFAIRRRGGGAGCPAGTGMW